jgi:hypothetical protein
MSSIILIHSFPPEANCPQYYHDLVSSNNLRCSDIVTASLFCYTFTTSQSILTHYVEPVTRFHTFLGGTGPVACS